MSHVDPWKSYDNFRVNHSSKRDIQLAEGEEKLHNLKVEYLTEKKFNVYDENDKLLI